MVDNVQLMDLGEVVKSVIGVRSPIFGHNVVMTIIHICLSYGNEIPPVGTNDKFRQEVGKWGRADRSGLFSSLRSGDYSPPFHPQFCPHGGFRMTKETAIRGSGAGRQKVLLI